MYNYVQPIIACTVAVAIGIDEFKPITIIATVMIFSGVYIVTQSKARSQM
jgi:EamA domain-containing membrane protein RarD